MGKIIFLALISFVVLTNLCFGQGDLLKTETKPSLIYGYSFHSQPLQTNCQLQLLSFYASYKRPHFNSFITNALIMQAEGDSLKPKTSFWKQAGIYGLEFLGGSIGSALSCAITVFSPPSWEWGGYFATYFLANALFTTTCTWGMGTILKQNGSWLKTSVGTILGCATGILGTCIITHGGDKGVSFLVAPGLGAVISFNIWR